MLWAIIEKEEDPHLGRNWEYIRGLYHSHEAARTKIAQYKRDDPEGHFTLHRLDTDLVVEGLVPGELAA